MKTIKYLLLLTLGLMLLAGCQLMAEPDAGIDLAGTNWTLSSLNGALPVAGTAVSLQFGADGTLSGSDGCNSFSTTYTQDGSNLTINQPMASTMMACEEAVMNQATAYMNVLANTTGFTSTGTQLGLTSGDQILATFIAGEGAPVETAPEEPPVAEAPLPASGDLAGTNWVLVTLNEAFPIPGTTIYLQFGQDGSLSGSDGCNLIATTYTQDGTNLTINPQGISTSMACLQPVMDQAQSFNDALANTNRFTMTEEELVLQNNDLPLATFAVNSSDLAGTEWQVVSYNNGREAVVSVLLGTEITANFGFEGDLTGSAGCNQYFTSYTTGDGTIEIGTTGSTSRYCIEPVGIMEQEAEYLAALQTAATYSIRGELLEMRTANDAIAVMMTRKLVIDLPEPDPTKAIGRAVAPQGLNVRSGPGTNFPVIGVADYGDTGEIVGRSADNLWWAVAIPSAPGGVGWVSADFVVAYNAENVPVIEVAPPIVVVPTSAPTSTPVPPPTATPSPQISFTADSTNINQGECTTLRWSVQNIQAVWVYPLGEPFQNHPVTGQGSQQVCPTTTTTYEMRVQQRNGSVIFRQVTVNVAGPPPTATAPAVSDPLAGTRWSVVNYNNGLGGVVTLVPGTSISLEFSGNQASGNSGCNSYFTSYQVNGSNITIGLPGGTQTFCDQPEGIMEQEAQYLAALSSAATFSTTGSRLELRTAGGAIAVVANQTP